MRKKLFLTIITIILILSNGKSISAKVQLDDEIKSLVSNYIKDELYIQKSLEAPNLNNYFVEGKEKELAIQKNNLFLKRFIAFKHRVEGEIDIDIKFLNISKVDDCSYKVNLVVEENIKLKDVSNITKRKYNHVIFIEKIADKLWITKDWADDIITFQMDTTRKYIDDFKTIDEGNLQRQLKEGKEYYLNQELNKSKNEYTRGLTAFNRKAMISYVEDNWNKRPKEWGDFEGIGGDCTNYISQIIKTGGAPMKEYGSLKWYYYSYNNRAPAWTSVEALKKFLIGNKERGPQGEISSNYYAEPGDIIQLDFTGEGVYTHSLVIVDPKGYKGMIPTVSSHSIDRYNEPLTNFSYAKARWIKLKGYLN